MADTVADRESVFLIQETPDLRAQRSAPQVSRESREKIIRPSFIIGFPPGPNMGLARDGKLRTIQPRSVSQSVIQRWLALPAERVVMMLFP